MTKKDLVDTISSKTGIHKSDTQAVLEAFISEIKKTVCEGDCVTLRGFGTVYGKRRAFKNFHAAPGVYIPIPEHYVPAIKFCKAFLDAVKTPKD